MTKHEIIQKQTIIAYEYINSIGNSLNLEEMLIDVVKTFVSITGAIGGKYILQDISNFVLLGRDFEIPKNLTKNVETYQVITQGKEGFILHIPIREEHFLFYYQTNENLDFFGKVFSDSRVKLKNAIDACRSVELLTQEILKNKLSEKIMISQSRMAIMGEMIGMIAHQWRQPITIIGMITNNTILDLTLNETREDKILDDLHLIDKQVHYLSRTINDFRDFFLPNKLPQMMNLNSISAEINNMLGKIFENATIELSFEGDCKEKFISYKNELLQVFLNILSNAKDALVEHNIENPKIIFTIHVEEENVTFVIEDNAGGIRQDIIEHIFDPYFTTKGEKNGTGLGLYMSNIIIEKHLNGFLKVNNAKNGAIFSIKIPKLKEKEKTYVY